MGPDWLTSWWAFGVVIAVVAVITVLTLRSLGRWKQTPPRDPETQQAEARLWSTRSMDQR